MLHVKQSPKRKRRCESLPILGVAGLSLTMASGASAATTGPALDAPLGNTGVTYEITLLEEEISDVSLATLYVFDKEDSGAFWSGVRFARRCVNCASHTDESHRYPQSKSCNRRTECCALGPSIDVSNGEPPVQFLRRCCVLQRQILR